MSLVGARLPDTPLDRLPDGIVRGAYWKVLDRESGEPLRSDEPGNLTGTVWMVVAPLGDADGYGIGRLTKHTVREHEDGTISVRPGDGSSNSILIQKGNGQEYHGFIEHGVWT